MVSSGSISSLRRLVNWICVVYLVLQSTLVVLVAQNVIKTFFLSMLTLIMSIGVAVFYPSGARRLRAMMLRKQMNTGGSSTSLDMASSEGAFSTCRTCLLRPSLGLLTQSTETRSFYARSR